MSTDETAIDKMLLRYVNDDVIQGAVSFLLKSKVYNTLHGTSISIVHIWSQAQASQLFTYGQYLAAV